MPSKTTPSKTAASKSAKPGARGAATASRQREIQRKVDAEDARKSSTRSASKGG